MSYSIYVLDCETTGLHVINNDIIELSIYRLSTDEQKTWFIKPVNPDLYEPSALKINGHKIEDLRHETEYGRRTYKDPYKTIIDIENWLLTDNVPAEQRFCIGQNVSFDLARLEQLWIKCDSKDSYPFGRRYMDTMVIEMFLDFCSDKLAEGYSLSKLVKKYGVKNEKAHSAEADTKATKEVFMKQVNLFKKILSTESVKEIVNNS